MQQEVSRWHRGGVGGGKGAETRLLLLLLLLLQNCKTKYAWAQCLEKRKNDPAATTNDLSLLARRGNRLPTFGGVFSHVQHTRPTQRRRGWGHTGNQPHTPPHTIFLSIMSRKRIYTNAEFPESGGGGKSNPWHWQLKVLKFRDGARSEGPNSCHRASVHWQDRARYWGWTPGSYPVGMGGGE